MTPIHIDEFDSSNNNLLEAKLNWITSVCAMMLANGNVPNLDAIFQIAHELFRRVDKEIK